MIRWAPLALASTATALGLVNLAAVSAGTDGGVGPAFQGQLVAAVVAMGVGVAISRVPLERLRQLAWPAWLAGVASLCLVLVMGVVGGGARSWLVVGGSTFQPSEFMKILVPLALAAELSAPRVSTWRRVGAVALLVGVPVVLVAAQPDMGAVGLIVLGAATVVWLAGLPWRVVLGAGAAGALAAPIAWSALADYQRERILTFLDPTRDPQGAGYQTLQSLYTIASGGWRGKGLGAGTQGRLGFLPAHDTDFILAALAEESGLVGASIALALLFGLVAVGLWVASRARSRFVALLAAGLAGQLLWQIVVNAGGTLGLLPLTGVTLPFLSRGGSSLLVAWATVGVFMGCATATTRVRPLLAQPVPLRLLRRPGSPGAMDDAA